jgi:segregation and condensation protein B
MAQDRLYREASPEKAVSTVLARNVEKPRRTKPKANAESAFPDEVYSSGRMPGAWGKRKETDDRALDLRIEGLLFVTDRPLTGPEISQLLAAPVKEVMVALRGMIKSFARRRSALELRERVRRGLPAFIIDLKPIYRPDVRPLAPPALAPRYIETLALIALNQPVPQSRLVRDRGPRVYDHVRILVERGLITKTRAGLSYKLSTTARFCSEFGLSNRPKDLQALLAEPFSVEEQETYDQVRAEERDRRRARAGLEVQASAPSAADAYEAPDSYQHAVEEAALELTLESEASESDPSDAVFVVEETTDSSEPVKAPRIAPKRKRSASKPSERKSLREASSSSMPRGLRSTEMSILESDASDASDANDDETKSPKLTRFQKLFLELQARQSNRQER